MFTYKVDEIVERIYIGNFEAANSLRLMKDYGFTHVLVAAVELPTPFAKTFTYMKVDVHDVLTENFRPHFDTCLEFIEEALKVKSNLILVHCKQGVSRSPTIVLAYLMKYRKLSLARAIKLVSFRRPEINPNPTFMKQLEDFDIELQNERSKDSPTQKCHCRIF